MHYASVTYIYRYYPWQAKFRPYHHVIKRAQRWYITVTSFCGQGSVNLNFLFACWQPIWERMNQAIESFSTAVSIITFTEFILFLVCAEFTTAEYVMPRTQPQNLLSNVNRIGQFCWQYLGPQWMLRPLQSSLIWERSAAPTDLGLLNAENHLFPDAKLHSLSTLSVFFWNHLTRIFWV